MLGLLLLGLGIAAAANLFLATVAAIYYVGGMMIAAGVLQLVHAAGTRAWGLWLLGGVLYLLAGVAVFLDPLFAAAVLTLMLAVSLGLSGIARLVFGVRSWLPGSGWVAASGIASIAAALVIGSGWPVNAAWVLGMVLAIDLMFQGLALLIVAMAGRSG
ncbi:HdeD family acid-resistance protein [Sphingomonas sp. CJ20]